MNGEVNSANLLFAGIQETIERFAAGSTNLRGLVQALEGYVRLGENRPGGRELVDAWLDLESALATALDHGRALPQADAPAVRASLERLLRVAARLDYRQYLAQVATPDGGSVAAWDLALARIPISTALLLSDLFVPHLLEVDGSVLLARSVERLSAESLLAEMNGNRDRITVERRLNSVDLRNELATTDRDAPLLLSLALRAKEGWAGALERRFPLRKFVVQLFGENEPDVSLGLTFWETR